MDIIFRVDASFQIGTGHVIRCLTLADELVESGVNVGFICRKHKGNLINKIQSEGFDVFELELMKRDKYNDKLLYSHWLGTTQQQDARDCIKILQQNKVDWLIVDHYGIDEDWQQELKDYYDKLMVIDDLADRKHQCNILLDQTFGRQPQDYQALVPKSCELLLGSQYSLLRPEFSKWRKYSIERRKHPVLKKLLINMGGMDVNNITEQVLEVLAISNLKKDINITIVMGKLAPHLEIIKKRLNDLPFNIDIKVDVDNMAEIMANADIAIGSSGTTTWERCCLGLPSIQIITAKNQEFSARILAENKVIKLIQSIEDIPNLLRTFSDWMLDTSNISASICDGYGTFSTIRRMLIYKINTDKFGELELHNYNYLDTDEKILALDMRNHPDIQKWMHNSIDISKSTHLAFIDGLKGDMSRFYFLVKQQGKIIGSINFTNIVKPHYVELGIYTNPYSKLKGLGSVLEAAANYFAFEELRVDKLRLEVFSNNKRAINFYNTSGYKAIETKIVNGKEIFCMEKKIVSSQVR